MVRRVLLGLLATLSFSGSADAALSVSYRFSANTRSDGFIKQFDPVIGTMLGYQIDWSGTVVRNFSTAGQPSGTYTGGVGYRLYSIRDEFIGAPGLSFSGSYQCPFASCGIPGSASAIDLYGPDPNFVGTGLLRVVAVGGIDARPLPGVEQGQFNYAAVQGTITYFFDAAAPEPATWATMVVGFGFVGFAMRSRRKTRVVFA